MYQLQVTYTSWFRGVHCPAAQPLDTTHVIEWRPEYERSDFGKLVRGKYAARASAGTNVVILEPAVAKAFPFDRAVTTLHMSCFRWSKQLYARLSAQPDGPARGLNLAGVGAVRRLADSRIAT